MSKALDKNKTLIKYSELLTLSNTGNKQRSKKYTNKKLRELLDKHVQVLSVDNEQQLILDVVTVVGIIHKLPPGTLFCLRDLVISPNRTYAQMLGKRLFDVSLQSDAFTFTSAYTGKSVYRRENKSKHLAQDFLVKLT